jgi:hypothetical protein
MYEDLRGSNRNFLGTNDLLFSCISFKQCATVVCVFCVHGLVHGLNADWAIAVSSSSSASTARQATLSLVEIGIAFHLSFNNVGIASRYGFCQLRITLMDVSLGPEELVITPATRSLTLQVFVHFIEYGAHFGTQSVCSRIVISVGLDAPMSISRLCPSAHFLSFWI